MAKARVEAQVDHDASSGFDAIRGVHETNTWRTLALEIRKENGGFRLYVQTDDPQLQERLGEHLEDDLRLDEKKLVGAVRDCRRAWHRFVVHRQEGGQKIFQIMWDLGRYPEFLAAAMPELARAGAALWRAIFQPKAPRNDRQRYESLRHIGLVLREELAKHSLWLRITSEGFYVPWSLLYAGDLDVKGSDWQLEGFWGYQHLIEHAPLGQGNLGNELRGPDDGPIVIGLQLDERIDQELDVRCIAPVEDLLATRPAGSLVTRRRVRRDQVAKALREGPLDEQILFFCCHAEQDGVEELRFEEAYLRLGDRSFDPLDDRITPANVEEWVDLRDLYANGRSPLVFLNACGTGQLNSVFYPSFGETFLDLGACCVVGAQVELPASFAGEFATRFLMRFLEGGRPDGRGGMENTAGKILFDLRREFIDLHNNPLGLIYSLFRGADTHLQLGPTPP